MKDFEEALHIDKRVENPRGEGWILHNIGLLYFNWRRFDVALASFLLAKGIFQELGSPNVFEIDHDLGNLHEQVGEEQFTTLLAQVEPEADQIVEQALREAA